MLFNQENFNQFLMLPLKWPIIHFSEIVTMQECCYENYSLYSQRIYDHHDHRKLQILIF